MAHVLVQTRLDTLFDNRVATGGGVLGMLTCGLLATLLVHATGQGPSDDSLDELPFMPGMVMALGSADAAEITTPTAAEPTAPEQPTEPTEATEPNEAEDPPSPENAVTEDIAPPARPRPPKPRPPKPSPASGKLPTPPSSTPAVTPSRGDPFGDPKGFDDMSRDGDAWARGVIAALDAMDVGTIYAKPVSGSVRFQMTICKDGRVSRVSSKGGTATVDERDLVLLEVRRLKIPRPPAAIAAKMKSSCVKLKHTFSWSTKGTR